MLSRSCNPQYLELARAFVPSNTEPTYSLSLQSFCCYHVCVAKLPSKRLFLRVSKDVFRENARNTHGFATACGLFSVRLVFFACSLCHVHKTTWLCECVGLLTDRYIKVCHMLHSIDFIVCDVSILSYLFARTRLLL